MSVVYSDTHPPQKIRSLLGCSGYSTESIVCLIANGDNNFMDYGIVENSLLFVDINKPFRKNSLNVYKGMDEGYELSKDRTENKEYIGRVIMVTNQYE